MRNLVHAQWMRLQACALPAYQNSATLGDAIAAAQKLNPGWKFPPTNPAAPVALRWSTEPRLGFPNRPFAVYRAPLSGMRGTAVGDATAAGGSSVFTWRSREIREVYIVRFFADIPSGGSLLVEALDASGDVIPTARSLFRTSRWGRFQVQGIFGLRLTGAGTLAGVEIVASEDFANADGWELIELVGLPFVAGDMVKNYAAVDRQGVAEPGLDGQGAALGRLQLARFFHDKPLPAPIPGAALWVLPDPADYLAYLTGGPASALALIGGCLAASDNRSADLLQVLYRYRVEQDGIRNEGESSSRASPPLNTAAFAVPVVATVLLMVNSDAFAACGLGYGTYDLPSQIQHFDEEPAAPAHSYKVVGVYDGVKNAPFTLTALSSVPPPPQAAEQLKVNRRYYNPPPALDAPASETNEISWDAPGAVQGYFVTALRFDGRAESLNDGFAGGWNSPYLPSLAATVDGSPPPGERTVMLDTRAPIPLAAPAAAAYAAAAVDVFGRWSAWRDITYSAEPPPVQKPGVLAVRWEHAASEPTGPDGSVPYVVEIDVAWNRETRRAHAIDLFSAFFDVPPGSAAGAIPGTAPAAFQLGNLLSGTEPLRILFDEAGVPRLPDRSPFALVLPIEALPFVPDAPPGTPPAADPDVQRWRLRIRGASCHFDSLPPDRRGRIGYAVYAVARERVREPNPGAGGADSAPSQPTAPVTTIVIDPRPPAQPALAPGLRWTALPDASGRARGVLQWPAAERAAGYAVWQATESALRLALKPDETELEPGTPMTERAQRLGDLLAGRDPAVSAAEAERKALRVFARINADLVTATRYEVDLPAASGTLYAFRVSAVAANNEPSDRSAGAALFAVPRVRTPTTPRLLLRPTATGVFVICLQPEGPPAGGYQVYRFRDSSLMLDGGALGEPRIGASDPLWRPLHDLPPDGAWDIVRQALGGEPSRAGSAVFDPVTPGWRPHYYAVSALGVENLAEGDFRGESAISGAQPILVYPPLPPALTGLRLYDSAPGMDGPVLRVDFMSDLPIVATPIGTARIAVSLLYTENGRPARESLADVAAHEVPLATPRRPFELFRRPPAEGEAPAYRMLLNRVSPDGRPIAAITVAVTDPLGRTTEQAANLEVLP